MKVVCAFSHFGIRLNVKETQYLKICARGNDTEIFILFEYLLPCVGYLQFGMAMRTNAMFFRCGVCPRMTAFQTRNNALFCPAPDMFHTVKVCPFFLHFGNGRQFFA
jgi:hypothetical protein